MSRITSPAIVGVKLSRMPNSLKITVTDQRSLHDWHRELAAGEEAGFLAVVGNQVRLSQALESAARLQRPEHTADASLQSKKKRLRKSLNTAPSSRSSKSGAANCCVVDRARKFAPVDE